MLIEKTGFKDKSYLTGMQDKKCLVCGAEECVGHHLGHKRYDDRWAVELCPHHHAGDRFSVHSADSEAVWWALNVPDIVMAALKLWARERYEEEHSE